ncbi:hypothetical protein ABIA32_003565 [Streptacidiphilus sp. MAP12-20]|uniref:hypothetical protein n=1 Tax=Streptacidiphilus sp. MAP12-20 TaxID=3156299 RepID=UPI0035179634
MSRKIRLAFQCFWFPVAVTVYFLMCSPAGTAVTALRWALLVVAWVFGGAAFWQWLDPARLARAQAKRAEALAKRTERLARRMPH